MRKGSGGCTSVGWSGIDDIGSEMWKHKKEGKELGMAIVCITPNSLMILMQLSVTMRTIVA